MQANAKFVQSLSKLNFSSNIFGQKLWARRWSFTAVSPPLGKTQFNMKRKGVLVVSLSSENQGFNICSTFLKLFS